MDQRIRLARIEDAAAIRAIYAPYVRETPVSFETEAPTGEEIERRIEATLPRFPWLVCERDREVVGYVYAGPHRTRAAYQWSVEVAVYIDPRAHRQGVGRGLYEALLGMLAWQGFVHAYAGITLPNPGSVGLHEAVGFERIGVYTAIGYKSGAWRDVGWWQRSLRPLPDPPSAPVPLAALRESPDFEGFCSAGARFLRR